jgi:diguanylate cyclase (GGDEF)-like protein
MTALAGAPAVFILSIRNAVSLGAMAERAGWRAITVDGAQDAERRFVASGAALALVDLRGGIAEALAAMRALAMPVETNGAAMLALIAPRDVGALDAVYAAGATHYLSGPFGEQELVQALRFACRHVERVERRAPERAASEEAAAPPALARRDPLTGLHDVHAGRRWIEGWLHAGDAAEPKLIAIMLGISRLDMINAAFGRETGDALIRIAARRIERMVESGAARRRAVMRTAGADFAILLAGSPSLEEAQLLATQLLASLARPFVSGDHVVSLGVHAGISASEPGETEAAPILRRASIAIAEARAGEGDAVPVVGGDTDGASAEASRLEIDLRVALDRDEIDILFQPQIAVTGGGLVGVEALARWQHPRFGELGAETLFAAAARSDYLLPLSAHVQRKAVRLAAAWPDALSHLRLAVNVTAADIASQGFGDWFLEMVDASGFPRGRLTVEITESGLIEDLGAAAALLAMLRAGGLRVAIDDFGTGYSSLAYLKALPLDYLKIDKRLAQDIAGTARDRIVVRGVIDMARSLGLSVIAEGVETAEQLTLLAREGCNYYQGFLFAPPVDVTELVRLTTA